MSRTYSVRESWLRRTATVKALDGIDLEISRSEVFGVVGPNGAGKTTLIKILSTLLIPTSGRAWVLGFDVEKEPLEVRRRIGVVFGGERGLYTRVSGRENMEYFSDLYGVSRRVARVRIPRLLERFGLIDRADHKVETYSRGMKQRLHIAKALVNDPQFVFLDEPTIGLDPEGARSLRQFVLELKREGKTVLLTTHYMYEADELCDRVAVINHGRIVTVDSPSSLKQRFRNLTQIEFRTSGLAEGILKEVRELPGVEAAFVEERGDNQYLRVQSSSVGKLRVEIESLLERSGALVVDSSIRVPTLEDVYLRLVAD